MPLSTIFHLYCGGQFYWRKPEYPEKTTDLSQVTDKTLSHNVVSITPRMGGIRTHNVSGDKHQLHLNPTTIRSQPRLPPKPVLSDYLFFITFFIVSND